MFEYLCKLKLWLLVSRGGGLEGGRWGAGRWGMGVEGRGWLAAVGAEQGRGMKTSLMYPMLCISIWGVAKFVHIKSHTGHCISYLSCYCNKTQS